MNKRNKYRIYSERTEPTDIDIVTECSMSGQRMLSPEINYLNILVDKYKNITDIHNKIMKEDRQIKSIETKLDIDFKKDLK